MGHEEQAVVVYEGIKMEGRQVKICRKTILCAVTRRRRLLMA